MGPENAVAVAAIMDESVSSFGPEAQKEEAADGASQSLGSGLNGK